MHFIFNKDNKPQVNHIDGNKTNNIVSNLEWVNNSENQKHAFIHGLQKSKLTLEKANEIINLYKSKKYKQKQLAEMYKIHQCQVSRIVNNKRWCS